ncbi:hypothetical protein HK102_009502, partial [Quaeritorhiza haematococci]
YEQANKYAIKDVNGQDVGFIAEEEQTFSGAILRQLMRTRRAFKAVVLNRNGEVVLKIYRPVKWFLNSTIYVYDRNDNLIGEVKQVWHLWRRKYDLFLQKRQFAAIDGGFWAWDFILEDENGGVLSSVNRNFVGFAREIFTDSGQYVVRYDAVQPVRALSLDERAVALAAAVTVDIDYFSRHSHHGGGWLPIPMIGYGGGGGSGPPAPSTDAGGVMAPTGGVGGGPMPFPIIIPGMGGFGGGSSDASTTTSPTPTAGGGMDMGQSTMPPPPPPSQPSSNEWGDQPFLSDDAVGGGGNPNQWGDQPFLSDEEALGSGSAMENIKDIFNTFFGDD